MRSWTFEIMGETPSKKNGQTFNTITKSMVKSASFRKWHENALLLIKCSDRPAEPLAFAKISVLFKHEDLRRRDGDNGLSSIQDLLQDAGIIEDDSWTMIGTPEVTHDVALKASAVVTVEAVIPIDWKKKLNELKNRDHYRHEGKKKKAPIKYNSNL